MTHNVGCSRRFSKFRAILPAALALAALLLPLLAADPAAAAAVSSGYRDFDFGANVNTTPTGEKPESKLWWADGSWWGVLWSPSANAYTIHRFNLGAQSWTSTGTTVDTRTSAKVDALWDGQRLYVLTHIFTSNPGPAGGAGNSGRLYRYSYNAATDVYTLDSGFPVTVNSSKSETLVLDKDSTGKLWVTWVEAGKVKVNRSTGSDVTWGTPFDLPVQGANVDPDDISSVVAFGGKIGIMWSNQVDKAVYFAVHLDGGSDTSWQPRETALVDASLGQVADDHLSLKASCGPDGALYAATKSGLGAGQPLVYVLKRTSTGAWSRTTAGMHTDNHTRPILLLDMAGNRAHVFAMSDKSGRYVIYMKSASLSDLQFPTGLGTPFIDSPQDLKNNNPSSTKQCLNATTGLLVISSDQDTHYYLHNYLALTAAVAPPTITAFSPTSGSAGLVVIVDGSGFSNASAVKFNGTAAAYTVESASRLRATVPAGATTGPISVTNPGGTATSSTSFTIVTRPTISAFAPTSGGVGTVVTVDGSGFANATAVKFNATTASFTVESANRLRATVPAGATTGKIKVTNPAGTGTSAANFTIVAPPTISSFTPASAIAGATVTINGTSFSSATAVRFNGALATFTISSSTQIRATVPASAVSGPISVTNPAGTATSSASFTFIPPPAIAAFAPASGPRGAVVTVDGSGFTNVSAVKFNATSASFTVESATRLRATVPSSATSGPIKITNPAGTGTSASSFTVILPPTISSFSPTSGLPTTQVTVNGTGFATASAVKFNGTAASFTVESDVRLRTSVPVGATSGPISVSNPAGTAKSSSSFNIGVGSGAASPETTTATQQVGVQSPLPRAIALRPSFPNPFSTRTSIGFELPRPVGVRLTIYDVAGRTVKTLVNGNLAPGVYEVTWDARDNAGALVSSGVYLLDFRAEDFRSTRRLLRMR